MTNCTVCTNKTNCVTCNLTYYVNKLAVPNTCVATCPLYTVLNSTSK